MTGKAFGFFQSLKMKGIGSKRMIIEEVSPNFKKYINTVADLNYASIELRPKGILLYINKGLSNYTWVIPYYQLYLYNTNGISIHAQGNFVKFKNNQMSKENKTFFKKLTELKIEYDYNYPQIDSVFFDKNMME